jgi:O-antigen ligase
MTAGKSLERWILPAGLLVVAWAFVPGLWLEFNSGKWLAVYLLSLVCLGIFLFRSPVLPAFRKGEAWGLGVLYALLLAHLFWFQPSGFEFSLLDRLSFLVLLFFSWRAFSGELRWEDFRWPLGIALLGTSLLGLWQVAKVGFPAEMPFTAIGSTFGYSNNSAQFLGIGLLLWWQVGERKKRPFIFYGLSVLALSYLVLSRGRSALIATALGFLVVFLRKGGRKNLLPLLGVLAGAFVLFAGLQLAKGKSFGDVATFSLLSQKSSMTTYRLDVWRQTLKMIAAHPLGVGVDRFGFEFIPFHRQGTTLSYTHMAISPHNEFLRYPAEDGLPLSLLFVLAYAWFFWRWWKRGALHKELVLPLGAFYLVQMAVQFPWQTPFTVFTGAVLFGSMAAGIWPRRPLPQHGWSYGVFALVFLAATALTAEAVTARLLEKSSSVSAAGLSCRLVPSNWYACLDYARQLLAQGDAEKARQVAQAVWDRDPWNYAAIRHLGVIALRKGNLLEGCFLTWKYDDIFHGQSDLHQQYVKNCPAKWRDYFNRKHPQKYYGPH